MPPLGCCHTSRPHEHALNQPLAQVRAIGEAIPPSRGQNLLLILMGFVGRLPLVEFLVGIRLSRPVGAACVLGQTRLLPRLVLMRRNNRQSRPWRGRGQSRGLGAIWLLGGALASQ